MNKKCFLAFLGFCFGTALASFSQDAKCLIFVTEGDTISLSVKDVNSIKYSADRMVVTSSDGFEQKWDIANMGTLSFGVVKSTSVKSVLPDNVSFDGDNLSITACSGSELRVYDAYGCLLYCEKLSSHSLSLNIAAWRRGVYIVNVGGKISKFYKK